jgi:GT2 family glycosyltransferase
MYSIVMAYHNREAQLLKTLQSFRDYRDIEVIIVNDSDRIRIPIQPFDVTIIDVKDKNWINPGVNFNIGFTEALRRKTKGIILQNPECYHVGDIIGAVREKLTDKNYLSFACYSLGKNEGIDFRGFNNRTAVCNGDSAWYNHSRYRPEALHFCAAITADNLRKINGFDERFWDGLGYEDNYLVHQIKMLGLRIDFIDDPFVLHQYHYDKKAFKFDADLYARTGRLCEDLKKERSYRAVHLINSDL